MFKVKNRVHIIIIHKRKVKFIIQCRLGLAGKQVTKKINQEHQEATLLKK